ncbi:hypothetical protein ACJJTC_012652 [Scirpophaga incertulas]
MWVPMEKTTINDAGVFEECPFRRAIEQGRLKIPKEQVLPGSNIIAPYVLLGDAAFPLKKYLLRPFPEKSTVKGDAKDNYNYRLSRARMFISSKPCLLHNIIRDLESINENELMSFRKAYQNMSQTQRHNSQRRYNATSRAAAQARENFKLYFEQHPLPRM